MTDEITQKAEANGSAPLTGHFARKAHDTIDGAAKVSADAEEKVREQAELAADRLKQTEVRARAAASHSVDEVSGYIKSNPLTSAGLAFAAGVLLSSLLRR